MDDDFDDVNIFNVVGSFNDLTQYLQPNPSPVRYDGADTSCELKEYDSVYNSNGERVQLKSGSRVRLKDCNTESSKSGLVRTKYWSKNGEEEYHELEIRSSHMKRALQSIHPRFGEFNIDTQHIILPDAGRCLFHYRKDLFEYGQLLAQESEAQKHVSLLVTYFDREFGEDSRVYLTLVDLTPFEPSLDFGHLWMLFKPRDLIYVSKTYSKSRKEWLFEFNDMTLSCRCQDSICFRHHSWILKGYIVNSNGTRVGYTDSETVRIQHYDGFLNLEDLPIAPLRLRTDETAIRNRMLARGRKFMTLQGFHHRQYEGNASVLSEDRHTMPSGQDGLSPLIESKITGRIIIDVRTFYEACPVKRTVSIKRNRASYLVEQSQEDSSLPGDILMLCPGLVPGYALDEKKWAYFRVDLVKEINFEDVFSSDLVLGRCFKDMIVSLVQMRKNAENANVGDVVRDKGKGVILLFHGEPGVGKTLTAESVADHCQKPLIRVDAGIMCTQIDKVEETLSASLILAQKWDAVALIDEADVFLQQRGPLDIARNRLVSAFLRILEYYEGIIILTTNRLCAFDRAVQSRIHLAIQFPKLDAPGRRSIWKTFLGKAHLHDDTVAGLSGFLDEIAAKELNGRQIRNVVQMAHALSLREEVGIRDGHIRDALAVTVAFNIDFGGRLGESANGALNEDDCERCPKRRRTAE